jgi:hypothetical protein
MTTPANLTYTDIQTRVANALRLPVTNTTEMAKIAGLINAVYRDIAAKSDWWWLIKRTVINTQAKIDTGTVSVVKSTTGITFSSAPAIDVTGYTLLTAGSDDAGAVYRIGSHTAGGTAANLDADYTNPTSTDAGYRMYRDSFTLPVDCGKVLHVKRYGYPVPLVRTGMEGIGGLKIWDTSEGKPQAYSVFDYACVGDPTSRRLLQVHPWPDDSYRLEIFYKQNLNTELATTTQPFIPDDFRELLVYGSLARGYPIFMNDLDRGKYFQQLFNDLLALMTAQQKEYASDHAGVAPIDSYRPNQWRRASRASGYTLGSLFDRLPFDP